MKRRGVRDTFRFLVHRWTTRTERVEGVALKLAERRRLGGSRRDRPTAAIHAQTFGSPSSDFFGRRAIPSFSPFGRCEPPRRRRYDRMVTAKTGGFLTVRPPSPQPSPPGRGRNVRRVFAVFAAHLDSRVVPRARMRRGACEERPSYPGADGRLSLSPGERAGVRAGVNPIAAQPDFRDHFQHRGIEIHSKLSRPFVLLPPK